MRTRLLFAAAALCLPLACGSDQFKNGDNGGGGGAGGSGGSSAGAGTAGSGGDPGAAAGDGGVGGANEADGGGGAGESGESGEAAVGGEGGTSGEPGAGGDGGTSGEGGGDERIIVVQASDTLLSTDAVPELSFAAAPHAGNAIIVGVSCISDYMGDCVIPAGGVTDNAENQYTRVLQGQPIPSSAQAARAYLFIAENISVPTESFVISVAPDGGSTLQQVAWGAIEVAGLVASPSDATGSSVLASETSTTAVTDRPTEQANELAVAVLSIRSNESNASIQPESGWTAHHIHQNSSSGPPAHSLVSRVLTTADTVSHTWTHEVPTRGAAGIIATFRGADSE